MSSIYLPRLEMWVYFTCHILLLVYSIYNINSFKDEISRESFEYNREEVEDTEWGNFKEYLRSFIPWALCHTITSKFLKISGRSRFLSWGYAAIGLSFLIVSNGIMPTVFFLLNAVLYFFLPRRFGAWGVLLMTIISLTVANVCRMSTIYYWLIDHTGMTYSNMYQLVVVYGWSILKCISFSLDSLEERKNEDEKVKENNSNDWTFAHFLGYVFYFPTLVLGPPVIYQRFRGSYRPEEEPVEIQSLVITFLKDIGRVIFWYLFIEFSDQHLHLVRVQYAPRVLEQFNPFCLFGYGLLVALHFHTKYVVFYGLTCAVAKLDGVDTPPRPVCLTRVHKSSDLWRNFDRGLYEFLIKYIYIRLQTRSSSTGRKLFATFVTFTFIYIWHGYFVAILAWSVLNALGILLENLLTTFQRSAWYQRVIVGHLSENTVLRIEGVLGTHMMLLMGISNFFFLTNYEVGILFLQRTYCAGILTYLGLSTSLPFIYFTSEYCKRVFDRKCGRIVKN